MRVLIACEESQRVCVAFREKGHEAYSCDIVEPSGGHPEWHIMQDVLPLLNGRCSFKTMDGAEHWIDGKWDMIIAHPPCTYLSNADRIRAMSDADLAWMFMEFRVDAYAVAEGNEGCLPNTQNGILIWLQQPAEEV